MGLRFPYIAKAFGAAVPLRRRLLTPGFILIVVLAALIPFTQAVAQGPETTCNGIPATIVGTESDDELAGTVGRDIIVGLGGADAIDAGGGNDIVCGGLGADVISAGDGLDVILGGPDNDSLNGRAGSDHLVGEEGNDNLFGGAGSDRVEGGDNDDTILGGPGNDRSDDGRLLLDGGPGNDDINGGDGNDVILGSDGNDDLHGGAGRDNVQGGDNDDEVAGDAGDDTIRAGGGIDKCSGGPGKDFCHGGAPGPEQPSPSDPDTCDKTVERKRGCGVGIPRAYLGTFSGNQTIVGWEHSEWEGALTLELKEDSDYCCVYKVVGGSVTYKAEFTDDQGCTGKGEGTFSLINKVDETALNTLPEEEPIPYYLNIQWANPETAPTLFISMTCPDPQNNYEFDHQPDSVVVQSSFDAETSDINVISGTHGETFPDFEAIWSWDLFATGQ